MSIEVPHMKLRFNCSDKHLRCGRQTGFDLPQHLDNHMSGVQNLKSLNLHRTLISSGAFYQFLRAFAKDLHNRLFDKKDEAE